MTAQSWQKSDVAVLTAAALVTVVSTGLAFARPTLPQRADDTAPAVGVVRQAAGTLRLRPARTLGWQDLGSGESVRDDDAVFVPPGVEARIEFLDGTVLELDERSLVVVEPPRAGGRSVTVRQGSVSGQVGATGLTVNTPAGETKLGAGSEARVDVTGSKVDVEVKKGTAKVASAGGTSDVQAGGRARIEGGAVKALGAWPVKLTAPVSHARQRFDEVPGPVTFTWEPEAPKDARLQLARDRFFAFVVDDVKVEGGSWRLDAPSPGVTWWRLVDARGTPLSESRRVTLVEDVPPTTLTPRDGEVVLAPPGSEVAFAWVPLPGITKYRVEVSGSRSFEPVKVSEEVSGNTARIVLSVDEGSWYWRLRGLDDTSGPTQPSVPARFRVIHKGIPDAPELLTPQIEVVP